MKERLKKAAWDSAFLQAVRRKLIQIVAFGFINSDQCNFKKGIIYKGGWKKFCQPGMNCHSCPAARFACPIGALQAVNGSMDFSFSFYVVGFLLAIGVLFGRLACGFLCPFGLLQELLHKIPSKKIRLPRPFTYIKYFFLAVFVFLIPVYITNFAGAGEPAFCRYLCPVGTLEAGLPLLIAREELRELTGPLFWWKTGVLVLTLTGCVFIHRFFCKTGCPLGAFYGLLNRISAYHLEVDAEKCTGCGTCVSECPMDVDPRRTPNSPECIRCGRCRAVCPEKAIRFCFGFGPGKRKGELTPPAGDRKEET